mgnify:CR=1 FL=1|tara:strand:- start:4701 stop:5900 length:1200 start_codon:yes stop_codon:yes gene_type:complete
MNSKTLLISVGLWLFSGASLALEQQADEGPHGGTLLTKGELALEITIFEQGIPPEMRIYAYRGGEAVDPAEVQVNVELGRLGGDRNELNFSPENDYLVGDAVVTEPHSFDVSVRARLDGQSLNWAYPSHEGRTQISQRLQQLAEIETERAGPQTLAFTDTLFGVVAPVAEQVYRLDAPYPGIVESLLVRVGDKVRKGQTLARLRNTQTLQNYDLNSPADGEVTALFVSVGQLADATPVLELTDLSSVWVELSAFPENIERLAIGQSVTVYDLHHHEKVRSTISYIAPQMTGGHIARARAVIENIDGHWRPGMHLKADVEVGRREAPLAVRLNALQSFREMPVVFARFGDTFEVRMVELGASDGQYVEVQSGLKPGTEYVTGNSFLIKADVLKDGASHDH